jgi:hypothetical protein
MGDIVFNFCGGDQIIIDDVWDVSTVVLRIKGTKLTDDNREEPVEVMLAGNPCDFRIFARALDEVLRQCAEADDGHNRILNPNYKVKED